MSVTFYDGLPGSGKSYDVVSSVVLPALRAGRRILTNLPLDAERLQAEGWGELVEAVTEDDVKDPAFWERIPGGAILCLDEVWRYWPAGTRQSAILPEVQSFFAEHRHRVGADGLTCEIVLISQGSEQLAKAVLALVEQRFHHSSLVAIGQPSRYRVDVHQGWSKTGMLLNSYHGKFSADVWQFYRSHTRSETGAAGREARTDGRGNVLRRAGIVFGLPVAALLVIGGVVLLGRFLGGPSAGSERAAPAASDGPAVATGQAARVDAAAEERARGREDALAAKRLAEERKKAEEEARREERLLEEAEAKRRVAVEAVAGRWRVVGSFSAAGESVVLLAARDGGRRRMRGRDCELDGEWSCVVDGALITPYTGGSAYWAGNDLHAATAGGATGAGGLTGGGLAAAGARQ